MLQILQLNIIVKLIAQISPKGLFFSCKHESNNFIKWEIIFKL